MPLNTVVESPKWVKNRSGPKKWSLCHWLRHVTGWGKTGSRQQLARRGLLRMDVKKTILRFVQHKSESLKAIFRKLKCAAVERTFIFCRKLSEIVFAISFTSKLRLVKVSVGSKRLFGRDLLKKQGPENGKVDNYAALNTNFSKVRFVGLPRGRNIRLFPREIAALTSFTLK